MEIEKYTCTIFEELLFKHFSEPEFVSRIETLLSELKNHKAFKSSTQNFNTSPISSSSSISLFENNIYEKSSTQVLLQKEDAYEGWDSSDFEVSDTEIRDSSRIKIAKLTPNPEKVSDITTQSLLETPETQTASKVFELTADFEDTPIKTKKVEQVTELSPLDPIGKLSVIPCEKCRESKEFQKLAYWKSEQELLQLYQKRYTVQKPCPHIFSEIEKRDKSFRIKRFHEFSRKRQNKPTD